MGKWTQGCGSIAATVLLAGSAAVDLGCAGFRLDLPSPSYEYFSEPDAGDAWSRKIRGWQVRQMDAHTAAGRDTGRISEVGHGKAAETPAPDRSSLQAKYEQFRAERKREMARDLAGWIQSQARQHYIEDGPVDHWATFEETLLTDGDDCDGLELLVFNLLYDLGFERDQVFRAVVYRKTDGQHHMVTLWFEDPEDPWVIDPTGAMTSGMPRMSEFRDWVPIKIFSEERDYTVRREMAAR